MDLSLLGEPSDKLRCLICLDVAKDPKQHEDCGKIFCSKCIEKNGNKPCPNCRSTSQKYFLDKRGAQEIRELPIRCSNHARGCQWEGTIGYADNHSATCKFAMVLCPNKCEGDGVFVELTRESISQHLQVCPNREFQCSYCQEKGTYASITGEHGNVCKKKIVSCPNSQCTHQIERGRIEEHIQTECEYELVLCKYKNIGCKKTVARKDMVHHEEERLRFHLDLAVAELEAVKQKSVTLRYGESIGFRLSGFLALKKTNDCFYSDSFCTIEGWKIRLVVYPNGNGTGKGTHVSVDIEWLEESQSRKITSSQEGIIIIALLNQVSDSYHHTTMIALKDFRVNQTIALPLFISQEYVCCDSSDRVQFLQEDSLYFRVAMSSYQYKNWLDCGVKLNNSMRQVVDDFHTIKQNVFKFKVSGYGMAKNFVARPVTIGPGYRMSCAVMDNDQFSCLVVCCTIGKHKALSGDPLVWPVTCKFTAELLNQVEDRSHHVKVLPYSGATSGLTESASYADSFISISSLRGRSNKVQYLKDGVMYFRITVHLNPEGQKPWLDTKSECMKLQTLEDL